MGARHEDLGLSRINLQIPVRYLHTAVLRLNADRDSRVCAWHYSLLYAPCRFGLQHQCPNLMELLRSRTALRRLTILLALVTRMQHYDMKVRNAI